MGNVVPFGKRSRDLAVDVDGDGVPDRITPGPGTDLATAQGKTVVEVHATTTTVHDHELLPVIPAWLRSSEGRRATVGRAVRIWRHKAAFHTARIPVYIPLLTWRIMRGTVVVLHGLGRWSLDLRADALEQQLATGTKADTEMFIKHREARSRRVKARLLVLAAAAAAVAVGVLAAWQYLPPHAVAVLVVVGVAGLVKAGTPAGHPVLSPAMLASPGYRELTDAIVMRALRAAGLGGQAGRFDRDGNELAEDTRPTLAAPIARSENGRGYVVLVDLPYGKTAGDAAAAVDRLASGLDVETGQVFPEPVPGSTRRVSLFVADEDPMLLPAHRSPLARLPKVSVWVPQPIGRTPVGRAVVAPLMFNSYLLGAVPRSGKSFAAKCLVTPGVLDPYCDLTVLDCGGGRDWLAVDQVAVSYRSGDDEEDLVVAVEVLEGLRAEARARLAAFRKLSSVECPEDKLTPELAAAGLLPHLIVVDEIQNLLRAQNRDIRKAALDVLTWLAKTAPKGGYSLVAITQRPAAEVIPADFRDVTSVRIALRTKTRQGSDAILGSDISATGYRTDRFLESHKGAAIIGGIPTGAGGDLQVVRTDLLTPAEFERACSVGRQRRIDAGTLRGAAAGEEQTITVTVTVVDDVAAVWPGDTAKVQAHVLVNRLREVYGPRYAGLDETALTRALKAHGVPVMQVFRDGANRQGYALTDLARARRAIEAD